MKEVGQGSKRFTHISTSPSYSFQNSYKAEGTQQELSMCKADRIRGEGVKKSMKCKKFIHRQC